jgi:hypothetical protein
MKERRLGGLARFCRSWRETKLLRQLVDNRWFALVDLFLVILSGVAWIVIPAFGLWFTLLALLPWGLRWLRLGFPFCRTPFDWVMAILFVTAWVGYWVSYDRSSAWVKVGLVMTAILMYFALSAQPKKDVELLSLLCFAAGTFISIYYVLTSDFAEEPGRFGLLWMRIRPEVSWPPIPRGYVSGLISITSIFSVYVIRERARISHGHYSTATKIFLIFGIITVLGALVLTWSGGILVAGIVALGAWILWKTATSRRFVAGPRMRSLFPALMITYLVAITIILYLGLANLGDSSQNKYGKNTRAELFARGAHFLVDYPITGAGLDTFPGLYSQYMIVIPIYSFKNSYNLFLDVAIEQGLIGGLAFLSLYLGSVWLVSRTIINTSSEQIRFFSWLSLFACLITIIHGLFYDYLYNDSGTMLLFFPVGISMIGVLDSERSQVSRSQVIESLLGSEKINVRLVLVLVVPVLMTILALNSNKLISSWYANLGAVAMSRIELQSFPTNRWVGTEMASQLTHAEALLDSALYYNTNNRTANHRLGLMSMVRQDFQAASVYLEKAHQDAPGHRGIVKNLAYCYVWLGKMEQARVLLAQIPEATDELQTYAWWWETQNRPDLARKASIMLSRLELPSS